MCSFTNHWEADNSNTILTGNLLWNYLQMTDYLPLHYHVWQLRWSSSSYTFQITFCNRISILTLCTICCQMSNPHMINMILLTSVFLGLHWWHPTRLWTVSQLPSGRPLWLCANWLLDFPLISFPLACSFFGFLLSLCNSLFVYWIWR